jgi:hypothetical protein
MIAALTLTLGLLLVARTATAASAGGMDIWPQDNTVEIGAVKQFGAYVPISPNTVVWSVNGVVGGDTTLGTISSSGLYQAPAIAPANNVLAIEARSTAKPAAYASTSLKVTRKYPWLWSVAPSTFPPGPYQVSFNGASFAPDSVAQANGVDIATTYVSPTKIVVTSTAQAGTIQFAIRQPGPGAVTGNAVTATVAGTPVTVSVSPATATIGTTSSMAFSATVTGNANTAVYWSVPGGSANGTITAGGVYNAPANLPASPTVKVRATSVGSPAAYGEATVTLVALPPVTVAVNPATATVATGSSQTFTALVTGNANTAVNWSVPGGAANGTVTTAGVYTAPAALPASATVKVRATSVANAAAYAEATVTLRSPPIVIPPGLLTAARILEQTSFGPTPTTLDHVRQVGLDAYLDQQFALPETPIPTPAGNSQGLLHQWVLHNYTSAPDQLRQRVIYALSQIVVASGNKLIYADELLPWMRILSQHAFGNYRNLLKDVSRSPSMGKYLDLANSMKPGLGGGANENYARELMQLFTIGLWELNPDGSYATNAAGEFLPTYSQNDVVQVALALTGWTYATAPGATPQAANWEYFGAPMETRLANHETSAKSFLGWAIPAGQTVEGDLESVLDGLMAHPNTAPFIATRLIRSLVTSNPSTNYVQRVAAVFANNGAGVAGDLKAVVRAIITDPEARNDNPASDQGRLKEPILHIAGLLRALNGGLTPGNQVTYIYSYMAQTPLAPPSVFSWFSPLYHIPNSPLYGPEFQIYTPSEAALRGNFFYNILHTPVSGDHTIDLAPFLPYGNDMSALVDQVNKVLLYGRMPAGMKQALITAATPGYNAQTRIETVLYLTALSGLYAVQH